MYVLFHLVGGTPQGLVSDEDIALEYSGYDHPVLIDTDLPRRLAPVVLHHLLVPFGDLVVILLVIRCLDEYLPVPSALFAIALRPLRVLVLEGSLSFVSR